MSQASWDIEEIVREVLAALQGRGPAGSAAAPSDQATGPKPEEAASGRSELVSRTPSGAPAGADAQTPGPSGIAGPGPAKAPSLEARPSAGAGEPASARREPEAPRRPAAAEDGQVRIPSRLVTMAHLRAAGVPENLAGLRRLVVRADALVTPLVRDELQRRNIPLVQELSVAGGDGSGPEEQFGWAGSGKPVSAVQLLEQRASRSSVGGSTGLGGVARLVLVVHGRAYEPAGLVRQLAADRVPVEVREMPCILRATDQLAEAIQMGNCLGVLLTRYAAIGVCAANRHPGLRAVWGIEPGQAAADTASLGANLLVINPRQVSPYQLQKMIRQFYQAGLRPCPEELKSRLG